MGTNLFVFLFARKKTSTNRAKMLCGGSMIHVFMRNRVKTRRKTIKIKPAQSRGKEWMSASRQQVCDELSRAESFLAGERKDRAGTVVPSLGIKRVLSSRGVVVTGCLYTGLRLLTIYHLFFRRVSFSPLLTSPKIVGNLTCQ